MPANVQSRVVLLTGAAGGLGAVMTVALLEAGHAVAGLDRSPDALGRLTLLVAPHRERSLAVHAGAPDRLAGSRRPDGLVAEHAIRKIQPSFFSSR